MASRRPPRKGSGVNRSTTSNCTPGNASSPAATALPDAAAILPENTIAAQPRWYWAAAGVVTIALVPLLFASTIGHLVKMWNAEPDYSHGFLVAPFAALMLW